MLMAQEARTLQFSARFGFLGVSEGSAVPMVEDEFMITSVFWLWHRNRGLTVKILKIDCQKIIVE